MAHFFEFVSENAVFVIETLVVILFLYLEMDSITEYISLTFAATILSGTLILILLLPLSEWLQFGLLLGHFLVVLFLAGLVHKRSAKKRTERMRSIASRLFFNFTVKGTPKLLTILNGFYPRKDAQKHAVFNVIEGEKGGVNIKIFDYLFEQRMGESKSGSYSEQSQTVILFTSSQLHSPDFLLRPRTWLHKVDHYLFGKRAKNLRVDAALYGRYLLQTEVEEKVKNFFAKKDLLLAYLKQTKGIHIETNGNQILYCRPQKMVVAENIETFLAEGWRIFHLFASDEGTVDIFPYKEVSAGEVVS
jgi:hypothetical protein